MLMRVYVDRLIDHLEEREPAHSPADIDAAIAHSLRCCRRLSRVRASPLPWRRRLRILPQPDVPCARLVLRKRVAPALLGRLLVLEALVVPREADSELRERDVEG